MTKLILGTAQFGSDYGIKHDGQPSIREIQKIAHVAWENGIRRIHTSWQYGISPECWGIFSKFEWIEKDRENPQVFSSNGKIGFSCYETIEAYNAYGHGDDIIQIPVNILDCRFLELIRIFIKNTRGKPIEIHARSVFLQGLLLMELRDLPKWIPLESFGKIAHFSTVCAHHRLLPYEAALGWVLSLDEIDRVIVGVNSARQLEELCHVKPLKWDYDFSIKDETVLDPRKWPA